MSNDLARLESASSLRAWEESRSKSFNAWRAAVESLVAGLRSTVALGVAQLQHLERFLRLRSTAEQAYVQALTAGLPSATKAVDPSSNAQHAEVTTAGAVAQNSAAQSPLLDALAELQRSVSNARQAFATNLLESIVVGGLVLTAAEFDKTSSALLQGLDAGLVEVLEAHARAVQAMSAFHRGSIEARPTSESSSDAWLQEHRYRKAVQALRERQQAFTIQLCGAVEEAWRLEEWRDEMARKVLGRFCGKLHQVEITVSSLANDGIRALAGHKPEKGEVAILGGLEKVLQTPLLLAADLPQQELAAEHTPGDWPVLRQLRALGTLSMPPASILGVLRGAFEAPRRWYGSQLCIAVLTKDHWLHCFPFSASPARGAATPAAGLAAGVPAMPDGTATADSGTCSNGSNGARELAYLEGVEVEPAWSFYLPASSVSTDAGKRSIDIEEVKRGFLGFRMPRRESLLADSDELSRRWMSALQRAQARSDASRQERPAPLPPPPPPPPPPSRQGQQPSNVEPARSAASKAPATAPAAKVQQQSSASKPARSDTSRGSATVKAAANANAAAPVTAAVVASTKAAATPPASAKATAEAAAIAGTSAAATSTKAATTPAVSAKAAAEAAVSSAQQPPPPPPPPQSAPAPSSQPTAPSTGASLTAEDVFGV